MRVLIVDDHVLFRDGLVSLLRSEEGFEVVGEAGSVQEAVEVARRVHPDLVLMDFGLPDGSGEEATRMIHGELPECKVVFLTVYDTDDKLFAALRQGAAGYLLKNMPIKGLLASLRGLARGEAAITRVMTARALAGFSKTQAVASDACGRLQELTPRELDVLDELVHGGTNRDIADRLYISENTVKRHINGILSKLDLSNRHEAVKFARGCGMK